MFKGLIDRFLSKQANGEARAKLGILSGRVGLISNFVLFGIKLLAGTISGSISILRTG